MKKTNRKTIQNNSFSEVIIYTTPDGKVKVEIFLKDETIWMVQEKIAQLFGVQRPAITKHLKNIFGSQELDESSVSSILEHTAEDGKNYPTKFYNLDAIIAVGYRVNSKRATQFRIWATQVLKEYIIKGFAMNDERLKRGKNVFGEDYFKELLERIRSIRASEQRIYLQITDIFAECSIDYDPKSETARDFYATVQNKFHYAITDKTAAEIIAKKVDKNFLFMGLTSWKDGPKGRILPRDVTVAKNYLSEKEIKRLERTISGFFDYIENLIENKRAFTMAEFVECVNKFLAFNEYKILAGKGSVSKEEADKKALTEYREFNKSQLVESDFSKEIKKFLLQSKV